MGVPIGRVQLAGRLVRGRYQQIRRKQGVLNEEKSGRQRKKRSGGKGGTG